MGIYVHRNKTTNTASISNSEEGSAQLKQIESEKYFELFKEDLLRGYIKNLPVCSTELKKIFTVKLEEFKQVIVSDMKKNGKDLKMTAQIFRFFEIKCRAIEGYFCYLNDYTSLQKVHQAKVFALKEWMEKEDKDEEFWGRIKSSYYKLAKGSYQLQGYQELLITFEMDKDVVEDEIQKQYEENIYKLKAMFQPLFDTKMVDQDIYMATIQ
jgi:hypothetical protein